MKTLLLAGVASAMLATAAPAEANHIYDYKGGCGFNTVSDGTDSPRTTWTGESSAVVVATTSGDLPTPATVPIEFECHMYIDDVFYRVINQGGGLGVAADSNPNFTYYADPDSLVYVCESVRVGWQLEHHYRC